jgi:hypothetical protein
LKILTQNHFSYIIFLVPYQRKEVIYLKPTYVPNLNKEATTIASDLKGPVGAVVRAGLSEHSMQQFHQHSHDHGGYEHYCEK